MACTLRTFVAALPSMLLLACASVPGNAPPYQPLPIPPQGYSNLYIYRSGVVPKRRTPDVAVDGKMLFSPPEGSYAALTLPAGIHVVSMQWPRETGIPLSGLNINLAPGQSAYVKLSGAATYGNSANVYAALGETRINVQLVEIDLVTAESELQACCKLIAP